MTRYLTLILTFLLTLMLLSSCQSVKPYQRVYLNDHFMKMGKKPVDGFGEKALTYREGSSGGGTGKSSGGCGCN
ncbi:MAG: DUF4266 domain-containing protein [Bacteroidales bacterium]|jgi:uncharacterized membrane protein|nr:DUF4266 domain-containing protein [Bacteroidales bacterium]